MQDPGSSAGLAKCNPPLQLPLALRSAGYAALTQPALRVFRRWLQGAQLRQDQTLSVTSWFRRMFGPCLPRGSGERRDAPSAPDGVIRSRVVRVS